MPLSSSTRAVASRPNLHRAWLWTHTYTDRGYRNFFHSSYRGFALSAAETLEAIRQAILSDSYRPSEPTKLFFPKASGILRPYTLLTIEDQIVYQAYVNIIADRLQHDVGTRYNRSVFGHLYAGQSSTFFYTQWTRSYRLYTDAMRRAHSSGYRYTASFDLTACYDSIDHAVLKYFLRRLRFDKEFCEEVCRLLGIWTEMAGKQPRLYHGHGIPQGPQPSGLLAECVLRHFDEAKRPDGVKYFRYVDDIRLFARNEQSLRREIIKLDLRSKEIGLFPQAGKIDIHKVTNIEEEIKSISHPPEIVTKGPAPNQRNIRERIVQLSKNYAVSNSTRFKYVLGAASPDTNLARRLIRIVRKQPHHYDAVARHLAKYQRLSPKASDEYLAMVRELDLYPAFTAAFLRSLADSIHPSRRAALQQYCRSRLSGQKNTIDPALRAAAFRILLRDNVATWAQVRFNVLWKRSWWVRADLASQIPIGLIGTPNAENLLNTLVRDVSGDVSSVAAEMLLTNRLRLAPPYGDINQRAQWAFKRAGVLGRIARSTDPIGVAVVAVLGTRLRPLRWRRMLGARTYLLTLRRTAVWESYASTDPTAWVTLTDTINDIVLNELFPHDGTIGAYSLGSVGSVLGIKTSRFAVKYPTLFAAVHRIHELRLEADLSHPKTKTTKKPTRRIRFSETKHLKRLLGNGYLELWSKW